MRAPESLIPVLEQLCTVLEQLCQVEADKLTAQTSLNPRITGKNQLYGTALPC